MRSTSDARRGVAAACLVWLVAYAPAQAEPAAVLRLDAAQTAALAAHPDLEAAAAELRAREAGVRQASRRPNPELSLELEDVAGSGDYTGVQEAQTTLRVVQTVELGGDRSARAAVAAHERDLARFDTESRRLDLLAATAAAFVAVLVSQEEVHHAVEMVDLARAERAAATERVRSGAALAVEQTRARVAESEAEMHEARGRSDLDAARRSLAALWGATSPDFAAAEGDLDRISAPPLFDDLLARRNANPDLARHDAERGAREAALALARARAIPDPTIGAGARHLAGAGDASLVFEVRVPIPLLDRQHDAITAAAARMAKAASERAAADRLVQSRLVAEHGRWAAAEADVRALRDAVLPGARGALEELRAAWRAGRASQSEVLGAQRAVFEHVDRLLHTLAEYHHARIACERLVGGSVAELN